jgi:hypothetical protein
LWAIRIGRGLSKENAGECRHRDGGRAMLAESAAS